MDHVHDQPDPDSMAADEQRIASLLRAVEVEAPRALHQQVAMLVAPSAPRRRRRRRAVFKLSAATATAAAVVAAIVLSAKPGAPTALRTSQVALERPSRPAPRGLVATGTNIAFPQWASRGWPAAGSRSDHIGGRTVTTEIYTAYDNHRAPGPDATLGYAIVSGGPLDYGATGRLTTRAGVRYWLARADGANIVAWVQAGHTCLIASRSTLAAELLTLAVAEHDVSPA
jgi:hypothetical protein